MQSMGQQTNTISDGWQIATEDFVGAYGSASALKTAPDKMIYRTDPSIERMQVYDYERKQNVSVYAPEKSVGWMIMILSVGCKGASDYSKFGVP